MKLRQVLLYSLTGALAVVAFTWPLFIAPGAGTDRSTMGPFLFAVVLPLVLALVVSEISREGISPRALAMLGVLSALGCLARPLSAGIAGLELTFILIVLGGRVFGPSFGFLLGNTTLLSSALITGGVGPWLPYQMLGAGFVGMGAALFPKLRGVPELVWLSCYSFIAGFA